MPTREDLDLLPLAGHRLAHDRHFIAVEGEPCAECGRPADYLVQAWPMPGREPSTVGRPLCEPCEMMALRELLDMPVRRVEAWDFDSAGVLRDESCEPVRKTLWIGEGA
ncbi:MAG TPA: hypothetical protein VFS33_10515 [Gemmatimonadales bacterium]|nr:hypothetical protein [Gemmatimonadales bacterium]